MDSTSEENMKWLMVAGPVTRVERLLVAAAIVLLLVAAPECGGPLVERLLASAIFAS